MMMPNSLMQLLIITALIHHAAAFTSASSSLVSRRHELFQHAFESNGMSASESDVEARSLVSTRNSFVTEVLRAAAGISIASSVAVDPSPVYASGGATAGGAYLLSAKQRYNQRVISGVKAFLALDARNVGAVEAFFTSPDEGGWEDLSAAGYLLANAFRTSSTKAPDSLPSVKKWKAFAKDMELVKRSLTKKDGEKLFAAYKVAEVKLDPYLDEVELTSLVR